MRRLLILISLAFSANAETFCPDQFTYYDGMGCIHFGNVDGGVEWYETFFYCEQLGGFQVFSFCIVDPIYTSNQIAKKIPLSFQIEVYEDELQGLIIEKGLESGNDFWLGLNDIEQEGSYVWDNSKTPANFSAWGESEPNGNENQNCIAATSQHFYFWSDENCYNKYQPVCESPVKLQKCLLFEDSIYSEEFDTCYQLVLQTRLNWTDSIARCKASSEYAYLVSATNLLHTSNHVGIDKKQFIEKSNDMSWNSVFTLV